MRKFDLKIAPKGAKGTALPSKKAKMVYPGMMLIVLFSSTIIYSCRRLNPDADRGTTANTKQEVPILQTHSATGDEFTIAVLGDIQYYTDNRGVNGQYIQQLKDQMNWIIANKTTENIKYVISVGDIADNRNPDSAHPNETQYKRADTAYKMLYNAGIPYGVVPGDHDISSAGNVFTFYKDYFGRSKFQGRSYYKDDYPTGLNSNVNHYDFVDIPIVGDSLIVVYLRWFDKDQLTTDAQDAIDWAHTAIAANPRRKAIVVTHYTVGSDDDGDYGDNNADGKSDWGLQPNASKGQAQRIYDTLKDLPNFMMMLGGHVKYEKRRKDANNGVIVRSFTSDYQGCIYPPGLLRTMKFSKSNDLITVRTFLPGGGSCIFTGCNNYHYDCSSTISTFVTPWLHDFTTSRTNDYDNNATSQGVFFDSGTWTIQGMSNVTFGASGGIAVPGDYNADGKTDQAVFSGGTWSFNISGMANVSLGTGTGDIPTPGDFDGNGTTDCAIYRPFPSNTFYVYQKYLSSNISSVCGSSANDIPVPMDYDGDGKVDFATFNKTTAAWTIPGISSAVYGTGGDIPVPGDYSGAGRNVKAIYRPSDHTWHVNGGATVTIGQAGDIPVPGDYNGDGKTDIAVYRPADGKICINGQSTITTGVTSGKPLNLPYHIRKFFFP